MRVSFDTHPPVVAALLLAGSLLVLGCPPPPPPPTADAGACQQDSDCTAPGACELVEGARCLAGQCVYAPSPAGESCDDRDLCSSADACDGDGNCTGQPVLCLVPPVAACVDNDSVFREYGSRGACDPLNGQCVYVATDTPCAGCTERCLALCGAMGCVDQGNPCLGPGRCEPGEPPACVFDPLPEGAACALDDGSTGVCDQQQCVACRTDFDCSDGLDCTLDTCSYATCYHLPQSGLCDDSDPCTDADQCQADGSCSGLPRLCLAPPAIECADPSTLRQYLSPGTCDSATGACAYAVVDAACADCALSCLPGCAALDCRDRTGGCRVNVTCQPGDPALCTDQVADDGTGCTQADGAPGVCVGGTCIGCRSSAECDDGNACTTDRCTMIGRCAHAPVSGTCDDNNLCTLDDACAPQGVCVGQAKDCGLPPVPACVLHDTVFRAYSQPATCEPGNGECSFSYQDQSCPDCRRDCLRVCEGVTCETEHIDCLSNVHCEPSDPVSCAWDLRLDGTSCLRSGRPGECAQGICVLCLNAVDCDDSDPCTDDSCDDSAACVNALRAPDCRACAEDSDCDDGNVCTADACQADLTCGYTPVSGVCDDARPCTAADTCVAGECVGAAYSCDDGNDCTVDLCDGLGGCNNPARTGACDDGQACSHNDRCVGPVCQGYFYACAADGDVCTDDLCDGAGGCAYPFNTAPCDDGVDCTHTDRCASGECAGQAYSCDDSNLCTDDSCNGDGTCFRINHTGIACDDRNACTYGDACLNGQCRGTGYSCNDGNQCTDDVCHGDGACSNPQHSRVCNDGDLCSYPDLCVEGACVGTPYVCEDGRACTLDACNGYGGCARTWDLVCGPITDLVVTGVEAADNAMIIGRTYQVLVTVHNAGEIESIFAFSTRAVVSGDALIDLADHRVGSRSTLSLAAGQSAPLAISVRLPGTVPRGPHFLGAYVDDLDQIPEPDEANNGLAGPTITVLNEVDLEVTALSAPSTVDINKTLAISYGVTNFGVTQTASFVVGFYLSADELLDAADLRLGERTINNLAAGATSTGAASLRVPRETSPGPYWLLAQADDKSQQLEDVENNNTRSFGPVEVRRDVDLVVSALSTVLPMVGIGDRLSVASSVTNAGTTDTSATSIRVTFYLSVDETLDEADLQLGQRYLGSIAAGTTSTGSTSLTVPRETPPLTSYVLLAALDLEQAQPESNEDNNLCTHAPVEVRHDVDLRVRTLSGNASVLDIGAQVSLLYEVDNQGSTRTARAVDLEIFLSSDEQLGADDVLLATRSLYQILAGAVATGNVSVTIPRGQEPGADYRLLAVVDRDDVEVERDEANNSIMVGPYTIRREVDLVGSSLSFAPQAVNINERLDVTLVVLNAGATMTSTYSFACEIYLSLDTVLDSSDRSIGSLYFGSINPGVSLSRTASLLVPRDTVPAAGYHLLARLDSNAAQPETLEDNNLYVASQFVQVVRSVDLVLTALGAESSSVLRGQSLGATATVLNQGSTATSLSSIPVRFYLSTDSTITTSDLGIGTRNASALDAGASRELSGSFYISTTLAAGTYYLGSIVDQDNTQPETNDGNNVRLGPLVQVQ